MVAELSTGRKVNFEPLKIAQRTEIDDDIAAYYYKLGVDMTDAKDVARAPFSLSIGYKAIGYACEAPDDLSNVEIVELFNKIYDASHLSDIEKKS